MKPHLYFIPKKWVVIIMEKKFADLCIELRFFYSICVTLWHHFESVKWCVDFFVRMYEKLGTNEKMYNCTIIFLMCCYRGYFLFIINLKYFDIRFVHDKLF